MLEALFTLFVIFVVVAVVVPLALTYLLIRQVLRARLVRRLLALPARRGSSAPGHPVNTTGGGLGRQWAQLVHDAAAARDRYCRVVDDLQPGPLQSTLRAAVADVDAAVAEAHRLAHQGCRTERAHRDVVAALDRQRKRSRRAGAAPSELESSLHAATRAQHESAERLAAAARREMGQLQLVSARISELTAHAFELAATSRTPELPTASLVADQLAARRLATVEVETAAAL